MAAQSGSTVHYATTLFSFKAVEKGDLSFVANQLIILDTFDGDWWTGTDHDGYVGQFPAAYVKRVEIIERAKILYDLNTNEVGHLSLRVGEEMILVLQKIDDSWWSGSVGSKVGIFPCNYVKPVPVGKIIYGLENYIGANKYELSFSKRDQLKVLDWDSHGWKCESIDTKTVGLVPFDKV